MGLEAKQIESPQHRALLNGLLQQRQSLTKFNAYYGLNRSDLEEMAYAFTHGLFNAYQAQQHFSMMNVQQVQRTIKKLVDLKVVEVISYGTCTRPNIYVLSYDGEYLLKQYIKGWSML